MATKLRPSDASAGAPQFLSDSFQRALAHWNHERLAPGFPHADWQKDLERDLRMQRLEGGFVEELRAEVAQEAAAAPTDADGFVAWFEALKEVGPGQGDPLFPWIAEEATLEEMRWFLEQEAAGEAGFDDLVAMTQVKLPTLPKLELARNYWDEMGRGTAKGMHGPMLDALVERLRLDPVIENTVWESLALANAMTAMAATRRYAWHSVGALGAIELTAPDAPRQRRKGSGASASRARSASISRSIPRSTSSIARIGTARRCGRWSRRTRAAPPPSPRARSCG
jgi:hypothetical protein